MKKSHGKSLSTNDFTNEYKRKVDRILEISKGYSAYEIAVQNGYIGTVEDWIISLKGEKGDTGPIGATSLHKKIILEKRKLVYK